MKAGCARPNLQLRRYIGEKLGFIGEYKKTIDKMLIIKCASEIFIGEFIGAFFIYWGKLLKSAIKAAKIYIDLAISFAACIGSQCSFHKIYIIEDFFFNKFDPFFCDFLLSFMLLVYS